MVSTRPPVQRQPCARSASPAPPRPFPRAPLSVNPSRKTSKVTPGSIAAIKHAFVIYSARQFMQMRLPVDADMRNLRGTGSADKERANEPAETRSGEVRAQSARLLGAPGIITRLAGGREDRGPPVVAAAQQAITHAQARLHHRRRSPSPRGGLFMAGPYLPVDSHVQSVVFSVASMGKATRSRAEWACIRRSGR